MYGINKKMKGIYVWAVIAISLFLFSKEKRKTLEKTQKHQRCFVLGNFYRNFLEKREGDLLRKSPSLADASGQVSRHSPHPHRPCIAYTQLAGVERINDEVV
jgi:hypothetical protein